MAMFLNPTGRSTYQIQNCERCSRKVFARQLRRDGDNIALKVCRDCYDHIDPWKLPPRSPEIYAIPGANPNDVLLPEEEA